MIPRCHLSVLLFDQGVGQFASLNLFGGEGVGPLHGLAPILCQRVYCHITQTVLITIKY